MNTTNQQQPPWLVVDKNGTVIYRVWRRDNAQEDADELNRVGLPEYRPYSVQPNPEGAPR